MFPKRELYFCSLLRDAEERRERLEVVDHPLDAVLHLHDIKIARPHLPQRHEGHKEKLR
jgi:hypothetical protein